MIFRRYQSQVKYMPKNKTQVRTLAYTRHARWSIVIGLYLYTHGSAAVFIAKTYVRTQSGSFTIDNSHVLHNGNAQTRDVRWGDSWAVVKALVGLLCSVWYEPARLVKTANGIKHSLSEWRVVETFGYVVVVVMLKMIFEELLSSS